MFCFFEISNAEGHFGKTVKAWFSKREPDELEQNKGLRAIPRPKFPIIAL